MQTNFEYILFSLLGTDSVPMWNYSPIDWRLYCGNFCFPRLILTDLYCKAARHATLTDCFLEFSRSGGDESIREPMLQLHSFDGFEPLTIYNELVDLPPATTCMFFRRARLRLSLLQKWFQLVDELLL